MTVVFCIVNWSQIWQLSDNGPCVCLVIPPVVNITSSHISHQSCPSFEDTTLHLTTLTNILGERKGRFDWRHSPSDAKDRTRTFFVQSKSVCDTSRNCHYNKNTLFHDNTSVFLSLNELISCKYVDVHRYISLIKLYILYVRWDEFERWALEKVISQGRIFVCSGILLCLSDFDRS